MRNNLLSISIKYLVPLVYSVLFYFLILVPRDGQFSGLIAFLAGFYLANLLLWADGAVLYKQYNELQTEPKQLITRSALFIISYIVVAIFVITSTAGYIGHGIVLGLGVSLLTELWFGLNDPLTFQQRFLFQLQRPLTALEMKHLVWVFAAVVAGLSILFFL